MEKVDPAGRTRPSGRQVGAAFDSSEQTPW